MVKNAGNSAETAPSARTTMPESAPVDSVIPSLKRTASWSDAETPIDSSNRSTMVVVSVTCRTVMRRTFCVSTPKTLFRALVAAMNSPLAPMTRLANAASPMASEPRSRFSTASCIRLCDVGK